jgi:hypothetical protein
MPLDIDKRPFNTLMRPRGANFYDETHAEVKRDNRADTLTSRYTEIEPLELKVGDCVNMENVEYTIKKFNFNDDIQGKPDILSMVVVDKDGNERIIKTDKDGKFQLQHLKKCPGPFEKGGKKKKTKRRNPKRKTKRR